MIGEGRLAEHVYQALSHSDFPIRRRGLNSRWPRAAALCLLLSDEYRPADILALEKKARKRAIRLLCGIVMFDEGVVGPLASPRAPGCFQCAMARMSAAGFDEADRLDRQMELWKSGVIKRAPDVSNWGLAQMGRLIVNEVKRVLRNEAPHTDGHAYAMNLKSLCVSRHAILPDPLCQVCGTLAEDSSECARISMSPNPKAHAGSYRSRPLDALANVLQMDYIDDRTGLMKKMTRNYAAPFCDVVVSLPTAMGVEITAGRSHRYRQSELTAILEGLERHCGMMPRSKKSGIFDSYRNLSDRALDPSTVGLYSDEQYASPDFPYVPFDPEMPMPWIWAYSFGLERPILIPEQLAYYGAGAGSRFVEEGSNGCALGSSLEEAILYGMFELAERDSFLLTWYAQLPIPRIDPHSIPDTELRLMIHRLETLSGYELFLFNMTMENGIPSIMALAKNKNRSGANLICSAGAHLDPIRAAKSAIFELAANVKYLGNMVEHHRDEYVRMVENPHLVCEMPDHALLYAVPEAEHRLSFLLEQERPSRKLSDEWAPRACHSDLTDDLKEAIRDFLHLGMDVIVVDQTSEETKRNGLRCAKVIIPGMLPMSFGHLLRRLAGLERVLNVPMKLGYADRPLAIAELNPHPHPFL